MQPIDQSACKKESGKFRMTDNFVINIDGDPVLPVQMPRGYGGTAVLWQKKIDHLITPIIDGGNAYSV